MSRERKWRNILIVLYAFSLQMPVYKTIFWGQELQMTIYEHANMGTFFAVFFTVLTIVMIYIVNYQKSFIKIADYFLLVSMVLTVGVVLLGKSANGFDYMFGFLVQLGLIAIYALLMFVPKILFKGYDKAFEYLEKGSEILSKFEVEEKAKTEKSIQEETPLSDEVFDDFEK